MIARSILGIMRIPDQNDHQDIIDILTDCATDHEVRWVVRWLGVFVVLKEEYEQGKKVFEGESIDVDDLGEVVVSIGKIGRMLTSGSKERFVRAGADKLLEFGGYGDVQRENRSYILSLKALFGPANVPFD